MTSRARIALGLLWDVVVAASAAVLAFRLVGASSGVDTNPPRCSNAWGGEVSCNLTQPVVMLPTFLGVLLVLGVSRSVRVRSRRRHGLVTS